ncbi:DnaE-like DNA polymerase III alpha [Gordonia phage Finkle]|uniref:DnaE-like DNA polymerase III alpha n=1 Tax=Gordonia phage Finkle TaxID=2926099 RepID=A0A9E7NIN5_9CAUD|nr:DnaE-like DNA polymerase III alpha [Gordonia phage Finkle]UTN92981.1 DnaE-like DNA polymerase III alpha [Gordonia phage Finkle]
MTTSTRPVVVLDIETTGLDPNVDQIWEIAAYRIENGEIVDSFSTLVEHDYRLSTRLPDELRALYITALGNLIELPSATSVRDRLAGILLPDIDGLEPTLVGACPWFDARFLAKFLGETMWHYRLRDVEAMTAGHLRTANVGGLSACLEALGLEPIQIPHRADGDADAALRIWNHLTTIAACCHDKYEWLDNTAEQCPGCQISRRDFAYSPRFLDAVAKHPSDRIGVQILGDAADIIDGDREQNYGDAATNFGRIAALWSTILGTDVAAHQVALCMTALKIARLIESPDHRDSWTDAAGYLALGAETSPLNLNRKATR